MHIVMPVITPVTFNVLFCSDIETKDEPFAWEAREFLRKKLVGKEVIFKAEKPPNSATREYGTVWAGKDPTKDENMTEALLAEGLVKVRDGGRNIPQLKRLVEIEDAAKSQGKGVWGTDLQVILFYNSFYCTCAVYFAFFNFAHADFNSMI